MASARSTNGWTYVVGRYRTAGNVQGLSAWRPGPPGGPNGGGGGGGGGSDRGGFYLVNSYRGGEKSSGVAWYNNLGGNDGMMPDKYVDIKRGDTVWWEGNTNGGMCFFFFSLLFSHFLSFPFSVVSSVGGGVVVVVVFVEAR